jgi:hypothetical protein
VSEAVAITATGSVAPAQSTGVTGAGLAVATELLQTGVEVTRASRSVVASPAGPWLLVFAAGAGVAVWLASRRR